MRRVEITAGTGPVEGHYRRLAVLERVLANVGPGRLPGLRLYLEGSAAFHREAIERSGGSSA